VARIYLDARAVCGPSGLERYCEGLIPALSQAAPAHEFVVVRIRRAGPHPYCTASNVRDVFVDGVTGTLPLLLSRSTLARVFEEAGPPDLLHSIFHVVPFGIRGVRRAPRRIVVTLHDLIWVDHARDVEPTIVHAAWRRRLGGTAIRHALEVADHVVCNSHATRASAASWLRPDRASVIYHGVGPAFRNGHRTACPLDAPYVAAFGNPKRYKNTRDVIEAVALLLEQHPSLRLLLIGGDGGDRELIERRGLVDRVMVRRTIGDDELVQAMRGAVAFVVPSFVEGFGLPAIEAMAVGTPLVVSNIASLTEVAGGAALTFEPGQPADLAGCLHRLLADAELRGRLRTQGHARAASFDWHRCARQTLDVYEALLAQ
jgi:glycosyltransferase involved in cell wall biosynthesis